VSDCFIPQIVFSTTQLPHYMVGDTPDRHLRCAFDTENPTRQARAEQRPLANMEWALL
jgi:hypothetical protein